MAGKLVQVDTNTVTSAVSSVTLTGIDSNNPYMLVVSNYIPSSDGADMKIRVVESGTPNSSSNYDMAAKVLRTDTTFGEDEHVNATEFDTSTSIGNDTGEAANWIFYIYNAYDNSRFTYFTHENVMLGTTALLIGRQGGGVFTSASQVGGLQMFPNTGNIASGTFTLYKVV